MRFYLFAFLLCFTIFSAQGKKSDNAILYDRILMARDIGFNEPAKGQKILDSIFPLLKKKSVDTLWGFYYRAEASILSNQQEKQKALESVEKSISYYKEGNNPKGVALSIMNKGNLFLHQSKMEQALTIYLEALRIAEKNDLKTEQGLINKNIGVLLHKLERFKESIVYAEKTYNIFKKLGNVSEMLTSKMNIANCFYGLNEYDKSLAVYDETLSQAINIGDKVTISKVLNNMAAVYIEGKNEIQKGIGYMLQSLRYKEQLGDINDIIFQYNNLAISYLMDKNYQEAEFYTQKAYELAKKDNNKIELREAYLTFADLFAAKGDYKKSLEYQKLHSQMQDSIINEENIKAITEMKTKYETVEKDNKILNQNSKLLRRNALIGLLVAILIIAGLLYRTFQSRQKLAFQKEILKEQDVAVKAIIRTEDRERKRMATHLHDGIGQSLSVLNMNISVLEDFQQDQQQFKEILNKTKDILDDAISDVRNLSHNIMPNMLIKHSLSDALRELIEKSTSPKLHIHLKIEGLEDTIEPNIQVVLYRIIQECIQNTIKHAQASSVEISIQQNHEYISVAIKDDGIGFDPLQPKSDAESVGLENMKNRIEILKGKITVASAPGKGTAVHIEISLI